MAQLVKTTTCHVLAGNFSSWECAGPGAVRYDLDWTLVSPDGTSITERHCEYAEVDLQAGTFRW